MQSPNGAYYPKPDLFKAGNILCIQPHPDDLEIGAGAVIALLSASGVDITCLTVTDGAAGTDDPMLDEKKLARIRQAETIKAAAILGIKDLLWLNHTDGGYLPYESLRASITRTIRKNKPDAVMVCDPWLPYEAHSDHILTGKATSEAVFLSGLPRFHPADRQQGYEPHRVKFIVFYNTAFPNAYFNVTATWDKKLSAIDCHKSQFNKHEGDILKKHLTTKAESLDPDKNGTLTECLKILSREQLHICEDAWQS